MATPNTITTAAIAGELRRIVGAEPRAPHASTQQKVGDQWAQAIGILQPDWLRTDEGRRWRADAGNFQEGSAGRARETGAARIGTGINS